MVSISHEMESEPVPAMPFWSWMSAALTVSVYSPWAVVRPDEAADRVVSPETRVSETLLLIRLAPPSSVSVKAPGAQAAGVDRLAEGDVDRRDDRISRVGRDHRDRR